MLHVLYYDHIYICFCVPIYTRQYTVLAKAISHHSIVTYFFTSKYVLCVYTYVYVYIYIYAHIYIYICVYTYMDVWMYVEVS